MDYSRHKSRKMFRRLAWVIGILFGFLVSLIVAGILVSNPDTLLGASMFGTGREGSVPPLALVVIWAVYTAMAYLIGFLLVRMLGWCVQSVMFRGGGSSQHHT